MNKSDIHTSEEVLGEVVDRSGRPSVCWQPMPRDDPGLLVILSSGGGSVEVLGCPLEARPAVGMTFSSNVLVSFTSGGIEVGSGSL
jgi:hypothetical protein